MSKSILIPSSLAAVALTGALTAYATVTYIKGVTADRFYNSEARALQGSALNALTLSMRAASDNSYINMMMDASAQADRAITALSNGSPSQGIESLPQAARDNLDRFEMNWLKAVAAFEQIAESRGSNSQFERRAIEAQQLAQTLATEAKEAIGNIDESPMVDPRVKAALEKAMLGLDEGIELLAGADAPNSDMIALALDASKVYVQTLSQLGSAMPREKALVDPLFKSFKTAQSLTRAAVRANESSAGTVDNAPSLKAIWAARDSIEASLNSLQHSIIALPDTRLIKPLMLLGIVGALLVVSLGSLSIVIRNTGAFARQAEQMANNVQFSQKERSHELRVLMDEMEKIGSGNLRVEFTEGLPTTNEIATTLNMIFPKFREVVKDVQQTIVSLSAASEQTLSMAQNTERSRKEQVDALNHIARMAEELSRFTKQLDGIISRTRDTSTSVTSQLNIGSNAVQDVHEGVEKLSQSNMSMMYTLKAMTDNIQNLVGTVLVVRQVAEQAQTVAFNAHLAADTIADDDLSKRIRISAEAMTTLTANSQQAAEQIDRNLQSINKAAQDSQRVLDQSQSEIQTLTGMSANANKAMDHIKEMTNQLVDGIVSVAGQSSDLNLRSAEVVETMEKIHHYSSNHSAASEQTATAIGNLNAKAQRVGQSISQFNV